ncbi:MAG: hypothetical protein V1750_03785 [Acidobacteriota bacterium]
MRFWRVLSGLCFVLGVYVFGVHLTAAAGYQPPGNFYLFALFGSNERRSVPCFEDSLNLPCVQGMTTRPNGAVEIVDLGTDPPTLVRSVDLGYGIPTSIAVAPDGQRFFVVDSLNGNVQTLDTATGAFLNTVYIPEGPLDSVLSQDGSTLFVTTQQPSVVAVDTLYGARVGEVEPGQPYWERLGGISAISGGGDSDLLAVAAISNSPAIYFLSTSGPVLGINSRLDVDEFCQESPCPSADDTVFTHVGTALLANLPCHELYHFDPFFGEQISSSTINFATSSCLVLNPRNSLLFSFRTHLAYVVFRGFVNPQVGVGIINPWTKQVDFISDLVGVPEAAALTPLGEMLYVIKQENLTDPKAPLILDSFDTLTGAYTNGIYTFSNMMLRRTAIDAKVVAAPVATFAGLDLKGLWRRHGLGGELAQLALIGFGVVLWRRDRRA